MKHKEQSKWHIFVLYHELNYNIYVDLIVILCNIIEYNSPLNEINLKYNKQRREIRCVLLLYLKNQPAHNARCLMFVFVAYDMPLRITHTRLVLSFVFGDSKTIGSGACRSICAALLLSRRGCDKCLSEDTIVLYDYYN